METGFTVSFFGHRQIDNYNKIYDAVFEIALSLLRQEIYTEFLIGKNGTFDEIATAAIRKARKHYGSYNSSLVLILPYYTAEFYNNFDAFYDRYTEIEIFKGKHYKSAIYERNKSMIDRSDLVIFYLTDKKGGTFKAYDYALKINKTVLNLAEEDERSFSQYISI